MKKRILLVKIHYQKKKEYDNKISTFINLNNLNDSKPDFSEDEESKYMKSPIRRYKSMEHKNLTPFEKQKLFSYFQFLF